MIVIVTHTHACTNTHIHTHIHVHTHIYTHTHTQAYTHRHTHNAHRLSCKHCNMHDTCIVVYTCTFWHINCPSLQVIYGLVMWYLKNLKEYGGVFGDLLCIIFISCRIVTMRNVTYSGGRQKSCHQCTFIRIYINKYMDVHNYPRPGIEVTTIP